MELISWSNSAYPQWYLKASIGVHITVPKTMVIKAPNLPMNVFDFIHKPKKGEDIRKYTLPLAVKVLTMLKIHFFLFTHWITTIVPSHFCIVLFVCKHLCRGLRGRPLIIWGGRGPDFRERNFFFLDFLWSILFFFGLPLINFFFFSKIG